MLIERKEKETDFQSTDVKDCDRMQIAQKLKIAQQSTERCSNKLTLRYAPSFPSNFSSTGQCTSHAVLPYRSVLRLASAVQNSRRND